MQVASVFIKKTKGPATPNVGVLQLKLYRSYCISGLS